MAPGPDTSAEPVVVLSGAGTQRSRTFDVVIGWQIVWQVDGDHLAISVNGDRDLGTVVDVPGPASGVTSPPVDGRYQLVIAADGPWTVTVIQGTG